MDKMDLGKMYMKIWEKYGKKWLNTAKNGKISQFIIWDNL
jgi:hypothetical protein